MAYKVEPSKSSYGRYVVRVSNVSMRFFWRRREAQAFADRCNSGACEHYYQVIIDGSDSGIVETNYAYASEYWEERARKLNKRVELRAIPRA